jgi:hypothetical protein
MTRFALCFTLFSALAFAGPALARDVAGVRVPEAIEVDDTELRLNGAGLRWATMFNVKVYVSALYLATPSKDPNAIVQADEPKSVLTRFLRRMGKEKIIGAFRQGFERNSGADAKALQPGLERIAAALPAEIKEGMEVAVTYVPGKGTTVAGPSGEVTIAGKPFADAMFRSWLGTRPADDGVKKAMLGR